MDAKLAKPAAANKPHRVIFVTPASLRRAELALDTEELALNAVAREEFSCRLCRAFYRLSKEQKNVLKLSAEGKKDAEIAGQLKIKVGRVSAVERRALFRLAHFLDNLEVRGSTKNAKLPLALEDSLASQLLASEALSSLLKRETLELLEQPPVH